MNKRLTKKELRRINLRHMFGLQLGHNYERMQGMGYFYAILPALKKFYGDDPEALDRACRAHIQFYNTTPQMSEIIIGMNLAIEEEEGIAALETATSLKTALMGPFAGVGDVIFGVIAGTIFGAIAGNMAIAGSTAGMWIWVAWNIAVLFMRTKLFDLGYAQGAKLITTMKDQLNAITNGASILGLIVVGALIPSVVKLKIPYTFQSGEVTLSVQENLDKIMPYLPQVVLVVLCYRLSKVKGMTAGKLIFVVMIGAIILSALKVIG
ncbi:PTS system mannose/fructose/sorbose family transporter subunit IID [Holdemania massiliensis]|uniref:PTS system mannose/fructose/sorbose family transporter subunit IID n=1 Tax=Holdemania massiliensis TaxID=1468449 RepID=UPI001F06E0C1|nr:PTS system mannose/fructose/sorbose family transporter subunit IID [Holdemania massiliensis]MCH1942212.1 PTS system mannose/fructose/sorbose family transporter subunit IID [Holdemania massiliensis]